VEGELPGRIQHLQAKDGLVLASISAPGALVSLPEADIVTVLARSADGGASWNGGGAPTVFPGRPGPIAFGISRDEVYAAAGGLVQHSTDAGASFSPTAPLGEFTRIGSLVASIAGNEAVWAKPVGGPAFRSLDKGASWRRYTADEGPGRTTVVGPALSAADVKFFDTNSVTLAVRDVLSSKDRGDTFASLGRGAVENVDGQFQSVDAEQRSGDIVLTTTETIQAGSEGVFRWQPTLKRLVSIDEFALAPLYDVQAPHIKGPRARFFFHTDRDIVVYKETKDGAPELPIPGSIEDFENPDPGKASLSPGSSEVTVRAGSSKTIAYRLDLPARSAILDTFFLLDTSSSTEGYINGTRRGVTGIARGLAHAGVDARFGLGEYQDLLSTKGLRYALRAQIGPADLLRNALVKLRTAGGEEPGYTALEQALTGRGVASPATGLPVAPGQEVRWRKRSLRTIVLIADESFAHDTDGGRRARVIEELKDAGVAFVGVIVYDPNAPKPRPGSVPPCAKVLTQVRQSFGGAAGAKRLRCQLEDLAEAAGTVAPAGGVDCDGNGSVDVAAGNPLVCAVSRASSTALVAVADPLRRLLLALTDEQPATLSAGDAHLSVDARGNYGKLDLKSRHDLTFNVTFSCGEDDGGERFPLTLGASVAGREVAAAAATLVCEKVPVAAVVARKPRRQERQPPEPPPAPPAPAAAPVAPVPPPAAPAPAPVPVPVAPPAYVPPPAPVSASAPAPAQAPATGMAMAARPETAPARTVVHVDEDEPGDGLNFTRFSGVAGLLGVVLLWPAGGPRRSPRPIPVREDTPEHARRRRRRRR
jgi:hypothetical protein